ncbi:hypothetical protein [Pseudogemmobacter sonorensis]|uniref:hypothetical protein n=1 Tax=Pseudogemmobacter sonorensis TaxID=2989681 RepID=UPI0036897FDE
MRSRSTAAVPGPGSERRGLAGLGLSALHGWICKLPKVNDIAIGIAFIMLGTGLAFFFGKPIQPVAPRLQSLPLGAWSEVPQVAQA